MTYSQSIPGNLYTNDDVLYLTLTGISYFIYFARENMTSLLEDRAINHDSMHFIIGPCTRHAYETSSVDWII